MTKIPAFIPQHAGDRRLFVYLIGRPNGEVKVGVTASPQNRFNHHRWFGGLQWCHLAGCGDSVVIRRTERATIKRLGSLGQQVGRQRETFSGISAAVAVIALRETLAEQRAIAAPLKSGRRRG